MQESKEYFEVNNKYNELYENLEKSLSDEQKKILEDLFVMTGGLEEEAGCTWFKEGFKTGLLVAVEVFN